MKTVVSNRVRIDLWCMLDNEARFMNWEVDIQECPGKTLLFLKFQRFLVAMLSSVR